MSGSNSVSQEQPKLGYATELGMTASLHLSKPEHSKLQPRAISELGKSKFALSVLSLSSRRITYTNCVKR